MPSAGEAHRDRALGQYFAPFRYYTPATARWNMRDPLGFVDGPNVYAYVARNPMNQYDRLGLCPKDIEVKPHRIRFDFTPIGKGPHADIMKGPKNVLRISVDITRQGRAGFGKVITGSTKGLGKVLAKLASLGYIPGLLLGMLSDFLIFPPKLEEGVKDPPPGYHWTPDWKLEKDPEGQACSLADNPNIRTF